MATKNRTKRAQNTQNEPAAEPFPLAEEVETYEAHLPEWLDREGQFVLIKGREIIVFFTGDAEAFEAGYKRFGAGPFLVKQICQHEPIHQIGNVEV